MPDVSTITTICIVQYDAAALILSLRRLISPVPLCKRSHLPWDFIILP